jgi:hypothetical protein
LSQQPPKRHHRKTPTKSWLARVLQKLGKKEERREIDGFDDDKSTPTEGGGFIGRTTKDSRAGSTRENGQVSSDLMGRG